MSLTKEQRKDLAELSRYFEKLEKTASKNNLDLDVFISEYKDDGYAIYATEQVELKAKAEKRKKVFEKESKGKSEKATATKH